MQNFDVTQKKIAYLLSDLLNEDGYIEEDLLELSERNKLKHQQTLEVLLMLQKFEPAGIFARNLKECLALQLQEKSLLTTQMTMLLENLQLVALNKIDQLKKLCNCNFETLTHLIKELKLLNPKPGSNFVVSINDHIIAEIFVINRKNCWLIELNNEALPKIILNKHYYQLIKKKYQK